MHAKSVILTESEVCTGNIKLRSCCIDRELASSHLTMSCHVMSCNISYNIIISYTIRHIISYHIVSYQLSYHIISCHIMSYHIISYHVISYHIISYHVHVMSYMSRHVISLSLFSRPTATFLNQTSAHTFSCVNSQRLKNDSCQESSHLF